MPYLKTPTGVILAESKNMRRAEALHATEPPNLKTMFGDAEPEQREFVKLPVEIHGKRVWVDDRGTWYAATVGQARQLQNVSTETALGGPFPLDAAAAYARAVIQRFGGNGRLLFTPQWTPSDYDDVRRCGGIRRPQQIS